MSEVPTRIPPVCWHFKTLDVRHSSCRVTSHQGLESQSGWSKQKGFFCDESCLLETKSATALQADRNKTKTSDLGKFNSEKVSWKQPFFIFFILSLPTTTEQHFNSATVTHGVSVWAGISVYYLRRYGHSAQPAVSVWSSVGEAALAEWSWTSHIVVERTADWMTLSTIPTPKYLQLMHLW